MRVPSTFKHGSWGSSPSLLPGSFSAPHPEAAWEFGQGAGVHCWCQGRAQRHCGQGVARLVLAAQAWAWCICPVSCHHHFTQTKFISSSRGLSLTPLLLCSDLNYLGFCNIWGCCTQNPSSPRTAIHLSPAHIWCVCRWGFVTYRTWYRAMDTHRQLWGGHYLQGVEHHLSPQGSLAPSEPC